MKDRAAHAIAGFATLIVAAHYLQPPFWLAVLIGWAYGVLATRWVMRR